MTIRALQPHEVLQHMTSLAGLLQDSVANGSSVGFLPPVVPAVAYAFWQDVAAAMQNGHRVLLVAETDGIVLGTVQLDLVMKPNAPHRAEVMKLLVHSQARRRGIGRRLMYVIEEQARQHQRTTLVLDTRKGDPSERLYQSLGYTVLVLSRRTCTAPMAPWMLPLSTTNYYSSSLDTKQKARGTTSTPGFLFGMRCDVTRYTG
ncbi:GNAT family N-acetyltransferase [Hymenobacter sp. AT01-02]|uniref:GNAT family N-acetyltransferase n=1 Tax=Hymenobacter sp. AT01-02 TaxID=1571877 RepID=UPI00191C2980|nr:GNAT family N-acetyltransferase [Hymenobacter sp. AT01-02]